MANVECRKFAPNIFNKSKCSNCFRLKEDHSASAIELNKASRKISKCGYLFVAPDWDFSNPINRTKRWQRRWFVLYDDGELTYSVDDHPETIPQACIDMNKVMEVARADDVTGNLFSVAITAPDRVHFVKGTCKEESTWWLEVLQIFPRSSIKTGRAKRNATFPGGISTTYMAQYAGTAIQTPPVKCAPETSKEKPRTMSPEATTEQLMKSLVHEVPVHDIQPLPDGLLDLSVSVGVSTQEQPVAKPDQGSPVLTPRKEPKREIIDTNNTSTNTSKSDGTNRYKKIKSKTSEGTRAYRSLRSNTCENLSVIPQDYSRKSSRFAKAELPSPTLLSSDTSSNIKYSEPPLSPLQPVIQIDSPQTEEETLHSPQSDESPPPTDLPVRGVPDGCGLDISLQLTPLSHPTNSDSTQLSPQIPIPSPHELLNLKKGWLMKQSPTKEWHKHWFVLQGNALMYFRDPSAENNGLLDGIIDLGLVQKVEERDVARNYGFIVSTFDERQYVLSAVTHGIRNNWINALKSASNLSNTPETDTPKLTRRETFDGEIRITRRNTADSIRSLSPKLHSPILKSPAEEKIRSEPSVPISPPLTRTPTSRIKKEKCKSNRVSSLKSTQSLSALPLQNGEPEIRPKDHDEDFNMIPERDTSNIKPKDLTHNGQVGTDNAIMNVLETEVTSLKSQLEHSQSELLQLHNTSGDVTGQLTKNTSNAYNEIDADITMSENTVLKVKMSLHDAKDMLHKQTNEIAILRKKLDNNNSDMDTTLKNLNNEQVKNTENEKKIQDLEQSNSLLQIKSGNAEKSLREQSKEITSLNQRVREFSDLSSQYKAQIVENKTLRHKLDKMERMNTGPNWKTLYESLQEQHNKERGLWENKLKEMENEMQNIIDTNNEAEQKAHIITDLSHQLQDSEQRINQLLCRTDSLEKDNVSLKMGYDDEVTRLKENVKELEEYIDKTDSAKNVADNSKDSEIIRLRKELSEKACYEKQLQEMQDKLSKSKSEVEALTSKILDLNDISDRECKAKSRSLCSSRENIDKQIRLTKMDSLAELMTSVDDPAALSSMEHEQLVINYNDVLKRFGKAISEIKALKNSVKTAQNSTDEMEIVNIRLNQSLNNTEAHYTEQLKMMSTKIEDLTAKYLSAEKHVRTLKMKCTESKSRRRSSTGIRPEEILVNKEAEHVLDDIEMNLLNIEGIVKGREPMTKEGRKKSYETSTKASRARRRSSESSELSFVDRLKKTEKTITDLNRKLSSHGDHSSVHLEMLRKQVMCAISKCKTDLSNFEKDPSIGVDELERLLGSLELLVCNSEVPVISVEEPGFPNSEDISSHLDTVMTFLFKSVENMYELRKDSTRAEISANKVVSLYEIGTNVSNGVDLTKAIQSQETTLQAYLLLDLQQQVSIIETKFFAYGRDETLKDYDDITRTMLLKLLESKQFVPLSTYTSKKLQALSNVGLSSSNLETLFRRLQGEAQQVFSRIGSLTQDLISVLTDAISCEISDKQSIVENIKSEVLNLIEEDERLREFQTSVVNIFLIGSETDTGRDPERVNLMANREEALQSQAEVARILIDQEVQDLVNAIDVKIECMEKDSVFFPTKEFNDVENLSQCIFKIASMMSQKCVTEAQITILNTILACEENASNVATHEDYVDTSNTYVFNPENMNAECNEFMLVLNNYRQQNTHGGMANSMSSPKYSSASNGSLLETNLKTIRKENENKKARLSAALDDKKIENAQEQKIQDLRVWCEKSMTAMEKSYENLLHDLQMQHTKEKDSLKKEKEQALAEETQATLAALDAMRKAHESEVQKEVEKFKKEFFSEYQSKACIGALQSEYQSDRNEIRREILSVTGGETWESQDETGRSPPKLTRSPSCPRLYSTLSLTTSRSTTEEEEEPLRSPLTGMVANRKRVFESEY